MPAGQIPWWWGAIVAPLLTGLLGVVVGFVAIRFDARKASNQELIRKRIAVYDEVVPKLNDLLCFFQTVGAWKALTPPQIIDRKRELDRLLYIYGPLFSEETFDRYQVFVDKCFKTYVGIGKDAILRGDRSKIQPEWGSTWSLDWNERFVEPQDAVSAQEILREYHNLTIQFAKEIGGRTTGMFQQK